MDSSLKYCYQYPHPAVAVDCIALKFESKKLQVLLIERKNDPFRGSWALPGGFMNIDETTEMAAKRELFEETNLTIETLYELGVYSEVKRDPRERVVSVVYYCFVNDVKPKANDDANAFRWCDLDTLPQLAFDHIKAIDDVRERLKYHIQHENIGKYLLPKVFTMGLLHALYEVVYQRRVNRGILQNKLVKRNVIVPLKMQLTDALTQPPKQFSFK